MKKVELDKNLTLYFNKFFPISNPKKSYFKHSAVVGIGGNIGDVFKRFESVYQYFLKNRKFHVLKTSPILENPPFGYLEQNNFLNAVLVLQTSVGPTELLKNLLHVEKLQKRNRSFKNAPRSIDLDIIFFDNLKRKTKNLTIPHPKWKQRQSVTIPLSLV